VLGLQGARQRSPRVLEDAGPAIIASQGRHDRHPSRVAEDGPSGPSPTLKTRPVSFHDLLVRRSPHPSPRPSSISPLLSCQAVDDLDRGSAHRPHLRVTTAFARSDAAAPAPPMPRPGVVLGVLGRRGTPRATSAPIVSHFRFGRGPGSSRCARPDRWPKRPCSFRYFEDQVALLRGRSSRSDASWGVVLPDRERARTRPPSCPARSSAASGTRTPSGRGRRPA